MISAIQATANITDLVVNSKKNCYQLFSQRMTEIQKIGVNTELQLGIYVIIIRKNYKITDYAKLKSIKYNSKNISVYL